MLSDGRAVLIGQAKQERIAGKGGIKRDAETHGKIHPIREQKKGGSQPDPGRGCLPCSGEGNASGIGGGDQSDPRTPGGYPERVGGQVLCGNIVRVSQDTDRKAGLEAMVELVDRMPRRAPRIQQSRGGTETSVAKERGNEGIEFS